MLGNVTRLFLLFAAGGLFVASANTTALAQPYWGGYYSSTPVEGARRGTADVIRSQGMANLANSEAAVNLGQARSQNIDNQVKATNAYWEKKNIYEQNMAPRRYEEHQKYQKHRARVLLKPLTPKEFNATTGAVNWPPLLQDSQYDEFRQPLTELFARRAQYGELSSDDYLQAKHLIKEFRAAVSANKGYPEAPLRSALRLLLKLNRELDSNFS